MEHARYPLTMAHPGYKAAQSLPVPGTERYGPDGVTVISQDYQGTPERLAPVTVNDSQMEEYYAAQGYKDAGHSDPAAYAAATAGPPPANYKPQEYPKIVHGVECKDATQEASVREAHAPAADDVPRGPGRPRKTLEEATAG